MQLARGLDAGEDARHGLTTYAGRVRRRKVRELKDLVDVAKTAAARAATYLRGLTPAAPSDWTEKGPHDFVTDADRAAEALIATTLTSGVPGSTVVGEELSPGGPRSGDVVWIVDPLDGTTNFLHRYPQYAVSIGCAVNGAPCVGVIHDILRDVVYWGRAAPAPGRANAGSVSRGSRKHATHSWALAFPSRTFRGCGAPWTNSPPSWEPRAASVAPARPHSTSST